MLQNTWCIVIKNDVGGEQVSVKPKDFIEVAGVNNTTLITSIIFLT
jgi:hypothetical protein